MNIGFVNRDDSTVIVLEDIENRVRIDIEGEMTDRLWEAVMELSNALTEAATEDGY